MNPLYTNPFILLPSLAIIIGLILLVLFRNVQKSKHPVLQPFPEAWRQILAAKVKFYRDLQAPQKTLFEDRIRLFLATKRITAVDTEIDDSIKLMVAASAIIPMFAFPEYNYPKLKEILIYPNSFDENFQTQRFKGNEEAIIGMVGNRFMNGTMILSKPDLIQAYDGADHNMNVGIHEFVHLIDKGDGLTDGVPEMLLEHAYVAPWLHVIKQEIEEIEKGHSDIRPYALKSHAEFLAVVSEYFFDNPDKFKRRHPELYQYLANLFHQNP
jgi:Mlc titration factor MtfA (ptsG expression regulator)